MQNLLDKVTLILHILRGRCVVNSSTISSLLLSNLRLLLFGRQQSEFFLLHIVFISKRIDSIR